MSEWPSRGEMDYPNADGGMTSIRMTESGKTVYQNWTDDDGYHETCQVFDLNGQLIQEIQQVFPTEDWPVDEDEFLDP